MKKEEGEGEEGKTVGEEKSEPNESRSAKGRAARKHRR